MPQLDDLPSRHGPRPKTDLRAPHTQLDQLAPTVQRLPLSRAVLASVADVAHVHLGPSLRAPPGSIGLHLDPDHACDDARAFLLGHEVAHIHVLDDGSLHAILPEPVRSEAIAKGWAEPHPFAGQPSVSPNTVMLYAPRDQDEVDSIAMLVRCALANAARGNG